MIIAERQSRLRDLLARRGMSDLESLSAELSVSQSTIRRDVEMLVRSGHVKRTHGGVVWVGDRSDSNGGRPYAFDQRLASLQSAATENSLREVQQTLEAIPSKQSKDQVMKMLADPKTPQNNPIEDVVRILKAMPLDKRKKILQEFKSPEEIEKLHEILRVIRVGGTDTELLQETRKQLQQQGATP